MSETPDPFDRALAAHRRGDLAAAEPGYRDAFRSDPARVEVAHMLGLLLLQTGRPDEARLLLEQAATQSPDRDDRQADAGTAAAMLGDEVAARHWFEQAIARRPDHAQHHYNLARLDEMAGAAEQALRGYRRAASLRPGFTEARLNAALIEAQGPRRGDASVYLEIGDCLSRLGRHADAAAALRRGLAAAPDQPDLLASLGRAEFTLGRADRAVPLMRRALAHRPDDSVLHSALIFALYFDGAATAASIETEHRTWGDRHAPTASGPATPALHTGSSTLRIGFVGCDFKDHSNAWMFGPLFEPTGDPSVESVIYADVPDPDAVTERFRAGPARWRDVRGRDNDALATQVREDEIDVLVDLIGHTTRNRLGAFALRPAPVQVGWVNPTGVPAVDWLLTDGVLRPASPDEELLDRERPWRLPLGAMPFVPPPDAPLLPRAGEGAPVFGCFNNLNKLSEPLLDAWGAILEAVPASSLLLKYTTLDDPGLQVDLRDRFAARGIGPDRLRFMGRTGRDRHLAAYGEIDVALDTFPGNGGVTTWEALWMGVPLIALWGDRPNGRASAAILESVGMGHMAVPTVEAYVDRAVAQAGERATVRHDRAAQRDMLRAAEILQPGAYARSVHAACRNMMALRSDYRGRAGMPG